MQSEHLRRDLPADGTEMTHMVSEFRNIYNHVRPHERLAGARPSQRYLAGPSDEP